MCHEAVSPTLPPTSEPHPHPGVRQHGAHAAPAQHRAGQILLATPVAPRPVPVLGGAAGRPGASVHTRGSTQDPPRVDALAAGRRAESPREFPPADTPACSTQGLCFFFSGGRGGREVTRPGASPCPGLGYAGGWVSFRPPTSIWQLQTLFSAGPWSPGPQPAESQRLLPHVLTLEELDSGQLWSGTWALNCLPGPPSRLGRLLPL